MKKSRIMWLKILIVILALAVVAGIYVYKNQEDDKGNNQNKVQTDSENTDVVNSPLEIQRKLLNYH
jgi:flagellar basal body-associated protein FliL